MSQDIVSDGLNQIMNAKAIEKRKVKIKRYSKVLIGILELMKKKEYVDFSIDEKTGELIVDILKLNLCRAIKPRYYVGVNDIDKYLRRFLPSRNFGTLVISTNKGLLTHREALLNKIGGSVIAYFY